MDLDEIWHRGGPQGQKGSWGGTPTPRYKVHRGGTGGLLSLSRAFCRILYKTKVAGRPWFSGDRPQIQIRKDLGPMSFWSNGHSLWKGVHKIKVVIYVPNGYLVGFDTLYPDPRVQDAQKGAQVGFWSLSCAFWQKLYQTKVAGLPQLSGNGSPLRTPNPNLEGPGLHVLLELWSLTFKDIFLKEKL